MYENGVFEIKDKQGDSLFYRVYGEGRPVILLHGFGMNNLHWVPFLWSMRKNCQFIMPDLRGFGLSKHSYKHYDNALSRHAEDTRFLVAHLGLSDATLAGYSLGALISMQYLQSYGSEGLRDVLLIDAQAKMKEDKDWPWPMFGSNHRKRYSSWERLAHKIHNEHGHSWYDSIEFDFLHPTTRISLIRSLGSFMSDAASYRWAKDVLRKMSASRRITDILFPLDFWHVFFDHALSFIVNDYDFRDDFKHIEIPVTLISGMKSHIFPYLAQSHLIQSCPEGSHITLGRSGHLLMFEEPVAFSRALSSTLTV